MLSFEIASIMGYQSVGDMVFVCMVRFGHGITACMSYGSIFFFGLAF
jgi:hypothetical protein